MNAEPSDTGTPPRDDRDMDYAALARDVRYLKAAMATVVEQIARQQSPSLPEARSSEAGAGDEERAILAYLNDAISPSEREEARTALANLAALVHSLTAEHGVTEDELADRFDAARRAVSAHR